MQKPLSQNPTGSAPVDTAHNWVDKTDQQLMERIGSGDKGAMTEFVSRYYNRILDFAKRHLSRLSDAEDIAQEAFIRVWRKASQWQDRQVPPHSWLYRIAYNLCVDELRKHKPETDVDEQENLANGDLPENDLYHRQTEILLANALRALPERQCTAIVLCNYQGFSNRDAASIMDVTVEALESLLSRGRRQLRKMLIDLQGIQS